MSELERLGTFVDYVWEIVFGIERRPEPKRARKKGRYVADDPSTKNINEAWAGGRAPIKE